jgi:hypothetical protein
VGGPAALTDIDTTGSGLTAALEQADIRRRTPEMPEVVVPGTGLSSSAFHIDAK